MHEDRCYRALNHSPQHEKKAYLLRNIIHSSPKKYNKTKRDENERIKSKIYTKASLSP